MKRLYLACICLFCLVPLNGQAQDAPQDELTIVAVGDIMMGTTFPENLLPPHDGQGIFDAVKDSFQGADILFGNLEGPLLDEGESTKCKKPGKTCYAFKTPVRYVVYLKEAGFTALHIANNHASDFGQEGIESTISTLGAAEIQPVGGKKVAVSTIRGKRIAIVGFFYFEGPYAYSMMNIAEAAKIVRLLKDTNDLVIVSFHGGAEGSTAQHVLAENEEFLGEDRGNVVAFSHAVIDAGADMVIGHGPHVLRALEVYQGKLIAYSLGNFLVYERFNLDGPNGVSMVLKARLDAATGDFIRGEISPVTLGMQGIPVPDSGKKAISLVRTLTQQDIAASSLDISRNGSLGLKTGAKRKAKLPAVVISTPVSTPSDTGGH